MKKQRTFSKNLVIMNLLAIRLTLTVCTAAISIHSYSQPTLPRLGKDPIPNIIAAMTVEEKSKLVVGMGMILPGMPDNAPGMPPADPEAKTIPEKVPGAAGRTHAIPRLGIPSITVTDGPAGIRIDPVRNNDSSKTYYATAWPVATLLASSWDTALLRTVGAAFGQEVHEYGSDILLGPALNIHRNPLGGRNFEYYSEDPLVAGSMAAALVDGIQSAGVGTSIKHFAANNQETDRMTVNTILSQRALREIYLKGFEIAVKKAHPWTVMSSYNLINGVYASQQPDLLTTVLRKEWSYDGFVMSDWFAGEDPVAQIRAGNDLLMPGNPDQSKKIAAAIANGSLDRRDLDRSVARILGIILRSPEFKGYKYSSQPDLAADAAIAAKAAAGGMVLLRNNADLLPLKNIQKIALFGNCSYFLIAGGTGSGDVNKPYTISLARGLATSGYLLSADLQTDYTKYMTAALAAQPKGLMTILNPPAPPAEMDLDAERISAMADQYDIAILTIGRNAGEGKDRNQDTDYYLTPKEKTALHTIAGAFHAKKKKLVVILNIGGVINMVDWQDQADAILLAWQPGMEGGNAISSILKGDINPSGKLATSFPLDYKDVPSAANFPGREFKEKAKTGFFGMPSIPAEVIYEEGIYVGYRYYTSFGIHTAYPFGYGLSYTNFKYGGLSIDTTDTHGTIRLSLNITNTGGAAGKEIVQLYVSAPSGGLDKPAEELRAFAKTRLLTPGETETLHFTLNAADLASFDPKTFSWTAAAGDYTIKAAASSEDIRLTGRFHLPKTIITEKLSPVMAPQQQIREKKPPTP